VEIDLTDKAGRRLLCCVQFVSRIDGKQRVKNRTEKEGTESPLKRIHQRQTEHLVGRCGVSKLIRRPSREISLSISRDESHIPEWLTEAKTERSIEGVQVSDEVTAKELGDPT
jgi:hypothetical protein